MDNSSEGYEESKTGKLVLDGTRILLEILNPCQSIYPVIWTSSSENSDLNKPFLYKVSQSQVFHNKNQTDKPFSLFKF